MALEETYELRSVQTGTTNVGPILDDNFTDVAENMTKLYRATASTDLEEGKCVYLLNGDEAGLMPIDGSQIPLGITIESASATWPIRVLTKGYYNTTTSGLEPWASFTAGEDLWCSTASGTEGTVTNVKPDDYPIYVGQCTLSGVLSSAYIDIGKVPIGDYATVTYVDAEVATLSGLQTTALDTHKDADDHTIYPRKDGSRMFDDSVDGWFDDGVNFRVTISGGIITNIGTTVSGGYSMS